MNRLAGLAVLWVALVGGGPARGQLVPSNAPPAVVRPAGPGIFEIGVVRVDAAKRAVSFPAQVNMLEGQIEYIVVSAIGKLHESILKTEAEPFHIHTAALLLLGKGQTNAPEVKVTIELEGQTLGPSDLVRNTEKNAPMDQKSWTYRGSRISEGIYLAQRDGSIVALIEDPDALVDNPGPDRKKDEIWEPNKRHLAAIGQPARVTLSFAEERKK